MTMKDGLMIGVLGGTGVTGSQVVAALEKNEANFKCIVRDPERAKNKLGQKLKLVQGDLSDRKSLEKAMEGLKTLFILCGHSPMLQELELNALETAKEVGVSYVVKASGSEKGIKPDALSNIGRQHYFIEEAVKSSGISWAITRPNYFMSTLKGLAGPIAEKRKMITSMPLDTEISMIHPKDIGEATAQIIMEQKYSGGSYFLTGAVITLKDILVEISQAVGRPIEYIQVRPEVERKVMQGKGLPDWLIEHVLAMTAFTGQGNMAGVTNWVQKLTGHQPRNIGEWLNEAKGSFGG
jgi:uncharacterized protein YbjT (DUF2867 family)